MKAQGGGHKAEDTRWRPAGGGQKKTEAGDRRRRKEADVSRWRAEEDRSGGWQAEDGEKKFFFLGFFCLLGGQQIVKFCGY